MKGKISERYPLTAERLRDLFEYFPGTGEFMRRVKSSPICRMDRRKGAGQPGSYRTLKVDDRTYMAHRLAWLYVYGQWPVGVIDHVNGIKDDNRIANLRDVSYSQNQRAWRSKRQV